MTTVTKAVLLVLALLNAVSFALMYIDKRRARLGRWRIPEATLLGAAALGGSVGGILGMLAFHHKTRKPKFYLGMPLILCLQLAAAYLILR